MSDKADDAVTITITEIRPGGNVQIARIVSDKPFILPKPRPATPID